MAASIIPIPSSILIDRPHCPKCNARMTLARRSPAKPNLEVRSFECATCSHAEDRLVNIDPMKSPAAGWANAHLEKPE